MTAEELDRAAKVLREFIGQMDGDHFKKTRQWGSYIASLMEHEAAFLKDDEEVD
jgi:hypothetical protein